MHRYEEIGCDQCIEICNNHDQDFWQKIKKKYYLCYIEYGWIYMHVYKNWDVVTPKNIYKYKNLK